MGVRQHDTRPMDFAMLRRQLPAVVVATMVVVAFAGIQSGLGAGGRDDWSSSLKSGDVVTRATVWTVTVTPTPDEVEFWVSGRVIATDSSAPFETSLDLAPGDYKLGFCYRKDGQQTCPTVEQGADKGIVARVKVVESAPTAPSSPVPAGSSTTTAPSAAAAPSAPAPQSPASPPSAGWSSSLKSGDVVTRGTVWQVTVTPTPEQVDFWASGRIIATDTSAPFETRLDLEPGDYKLGFCHRNDRVQKCETTESGLGTGIVARVKVVESAPTAPTASTTAPSKDSGATATSSNAGAVSSRTGESSSPTSSSSTATSSSPTTATKSDQTAPRSVRRIDVTAAGASSVNVQWPSSRDNVGVAGYGLFLDGRTVGATPETRYAFGGLACGTGYLVGVDAYDAAGNHSRQTSTTVSTTACPDLSPPTVPTAIRLAASTETSVVLSWQASSDNIGVVGYGLYVGGFRVASTSEPAATLSGLSCGRSYDVGIDAVDAAGNRSARTSSYFSTSPCPADKTAPSQPNNLGVGAATTTSVTLSWSASTDNTGVSGYGLYRDSTRVDTTTQTSATFSGLTCGTTYQLGVDAVDAAGNRSAVASASAATQPCAPAPTGDGWTSSLKTGDVVPRGTVWQVTVTPTPDEVEFWASGRVIATDTSAPFETPLNLDPGDYKLGFCHTTDGAQKCETTESGEGTGIVARVTIVDASAPAPTGDTSPPSVPGSLRMVTAAPTSLSMAWSASTDNVAVTGYGEYRGTSRIATTTQTSASFAGLTCGTAYQVGVDAFDAAGNRSSRSDMTATTSACPDTQAPSVPTNVVVGTRTGTSIALSWSPSTDDVGVVAYGLYRGGAVVGSTAGTTGIVTGLSCGTNYTLAIDAVDAAGNRSAQAVVMVATAACADTQAPTAPTGLAVSGVTQTAMTLSWTASTDNVGVVKYRVYRGTTMVAEQAAPPTSLSGLTCGTTYTLGVEALDAAGNVSPRASLTYSTSTCQLSQPATVYVTSSGSDSNPCTQAAPCRSFQRGYAVAQPGQIVQVAGGSYPRQQMSRVSSHTDPNDVIIQPASGETVNVAGLTLGSQGYNTGPEHLTIRGIRDSRSPMGAFEAIGTNDVTFENLRAGNFYENYSSNFTVKGGDYGPCTVPSSVCSNNKLDVQTGDNILVDGVQMHDFRIVPYSGQHFECMIIFGGRYITIRNSSFTNCEFYNIFVQHPAWAGYAGSDGTWPRDMLLERNTFTLTYADGNLNGAGAPGIAFSPRQVPFYNVMIKCNTFLQNSGVSVNDDRDGTQYVNFSIVSSGC
jgi:chitodextrinase